MRITIPVSGDGEAWLAHLPEFNVEPEEVLDERGRLIIPKIIEHFKRCNASMAERYGREMFQYSSSDGFNVVSMTVEFLRQLSAVTHWMSSKPEAKAHTSDDGSPSDRRLERRMAKDQVAFCRVDVRGVSTGVKFVVGYADPFEKVIGNCDLGSREFAIYVTRILLNMEEAINAQSAERGSEMRVMIDERNPGLIAESRYREAIGQERDRIREANAKRGECPQNKAGFCCPINPSCRCYHNGACIEATFDEAAFRVRYEDERKRDEVCDVG